jgi:arylformamidase
MTLRRGGGVKIYDISQTLREGIAVWPGDPEFRQRWILRRRDGEPSNLSAVAMGTHTGTHLDAPLHLEDSGRDIAKLPLRHCLGPARVFSISKKSIGVQDLSKLDWRGVERVLFKTRAGRSRQPAFDRDFAHLQEDAAAFLVRRGILLVGIDAPSVDAFESEKLPSHRRLLCHGIVILEGVRLGGVPPGDYELVCLPLKLAGSEGSPVRAVLLK